MAAPRTANWCLQLVVLTGACTGSLEDPGEPVPPVPPPGEAPMIEITGPAVLPHVQAFANAACAAVQSCKPSTYAGHHPNASQAVDSLVSDVYGEVPSDDNALGDALAEFALAHQQEFGIWYVIWQQRFNDGSGWDPMEDRGSITQNHYDHVHVSFNESL